MMKDKFDFTKGTITFDDLEKLFNINNIVTC
jgi:hypothetical protein